MNMTASGAKSDSSFFPSDKPAKVKKTKGILNYFDDIRENDALANEGKIVPLIFISPSGPLNIHMTNLQP
jgi:hypothetical protein